MRELLGFVCISCDYKRDYFIGVDFQDGKTRKLYCCKKCHSVFGTKYMKRKCDECRNTEFEELERIEQNFRCPKCKKTTLSEQYSGHWS